MQEAEFIYGLNRLNVAVTRARTKCVVFLPRPLLEASLQVLDQPEAIRGVAFMRDLVAAVSRCGERELFRTGRRRQRGGLLRGDVFSAAIAGSGSQLRGRRPPARTGR